MTASEFETQHSDSTVCSGLYTKSTPKWNTKMHASKLLKGVLISRTLNSTSADQESSSASSPARGKRAFSSDVTAPKSLVQRKASSSPVKTTCLCAPTKHAGSFRCRLHRVTQKHWDGRQISTTAAAAAAASSSAGSPSPANENSGTVGVITPWANGVAVPTTGSRTGAARPSRLRMVVVAAPHGEDHGNPDVHRPDSPMLSEGPALIVPRTWLTGAV